MISTMLRVGLLLALTVGVARAEPAPRALMLTGPLSPAASAELSHQAARRGIEVALPAPEAEPASESVIAEVRPLYQNMAFGQAVKRLTAAEASLVAGRLPTAGLTRALADLQLWMGACLLLEEDRAAAIDHWELALRLWPQARLDRLFPPEVRAAFPRSAGGRAVRVQVRLAPNGARLWLDGKRVDGPLTTTLGLHYVVVERADRVPVAQVVRIIHAAPQIAVSLDEQAEPAAALRQAAARLRTAPLGREEGLGVSVALGRPLTVVSAIDDRLVATRFAAADPARPVAASEAGSAAALVTSLCAADPGCLPVVDPVPAPAIAVTAVPSHPPPPARPVWKRAWFWGVLGAGVVAAAAVATGAALGATAPRDYDLHVR